MGFLAVQCAIRGRPGSLCLLPVGDRCLSFWKSAARKSAPTVAQIVPCNLAILTLTELSRISPRCDTATQPFSDRTANKVVQDLLPHASERMTKDVYDDAVSDEKRKANKGVVRMITRAKEAAKDVAKGVAVGGRSDK